MKIIIISFFYLIATNPIFSESAKYDGKLSHYYNAQSAPNHLIAKTLTNLIGDQWEKNIDLNKLIPKQIQQSISVGSDDNIQSMVGLFFVSEYLSEFEPYSMPFKQWNRPAVVSLLENNSDRGHRPDTPTTIGDNMMQFLSAVDCSLIELYDASFEIDQMKYLNGITTLEVLAFPVRGMKFDKPFQFPKHLKCMVVRNCELTNHFFLALRELKQLETLIILNCAVTLDDPVSIEFGFEKHRSFEGKERIFKNGLSNLKKLVIEESHSNIFNYLLPEKWSSLEVIDVDIFLGSMDAVRGVFHKRYFRETFPKLSQATIRAKSSHHETINKCLHDLDNLKFKIMEYP